MDQGGRGLVGRGRALAGAFLLMLAAVLVAGAGVAKAAPVGDCGTPQARVNRALASLHFPWRALHYRYVARSPRADGLMALTWTGTIRRTEVYVQPCGQESDALLRHVIAHEVGHAIDDEWGSKNERKGWLKARGLGSSTPWYACDGCPVWDTGEGDFVEVFSLWQTGQFHSDLAPPPTRTQLKKLVRLIPRHRPLLGRPTTSDPGAGAITVTGSGTTAPPPSYAYPPAPAPDPIVPVVPPTAAPTPVPAPSPTHCVYWLFVPVCS
ncbi:MAG TPA: hypothetical protein VHE83_10090 [Mycobacteriales bacterium]|nr:hypothetical protein [Mycobacteriales bacterium]